MSFLIPDINTFFLLHTHFFSLLVYHVPILSYNPTVYTLCTVSTWGSVYLCKYLIIFTHGFPPEIFFFPILFTFICFYSHFSRSSFIFIAFLNNSSPITNKTEIALTPTFIFPVI